MQVSVLPAASRFLVPANDAPHLRWDLSPTGSAGPAHSQNQPDYIDQPPPQSSDFAIPSTPHCSGSLSGFKNLPGYFLSHVVFHSSGLRERGGGKQCLRKTDFSCFFSVPFQSFPVAQLVKNQPTMQETRIQFLGQEDPLEKEMPPYWGPARVRSRDSLRMMALAI